MAAVRKQVLDPFERLTGQQAVAVSIRRSRRGQDHASQIPKHPACGHCSDTSVARDGWRQHLRELGRAMEPHWHRCECHKLCGVVPLILEGRCLAVCRVVCPESVGEHQFAQWLELLDVLGQNFVMRQGHVVPRRSARRPRRPAAPHSERTRRPANLPSHPRIPDALAFIERELSNPRLSVARVAEELGVNAAYLAHLFSVHTGVRMSHYIERQRIEQAQRLLASTSWQIKQVAYATGHGNADWFSQVFRRHTGVTPSAYRRRMQTISA